MGQHRRGRLVPTEYGCLEQRQQHLRTGAILAVFKVAKLLKDDPRLVMPTKKGENHGSGCLYWTNRRILFPGHLLGVAPEVIAKSACIQGGDHSELFGALVYCITARNGFLEIPVKEGEIGWRAHGE